MTAVPGADPAALLDTADAGLILVRAPTGTYEPVEILEVNHRLLELTGHDRASLLGRSLRRLRGRSERRERFAALLAAIEDGRPFDEPLAIARADGADRTLRVRLAHPPGAPGLAVLWFRPEAGEAPGDPAELPRHAGPWSGLVREGLYLLALDEALRPRLVWADTRFHALLGEAEAVAQGPAALALAEDRERLRARDQRLLAGRETVVRYRLRAADGTVRTVCDSSRPLCDRDGIVRLVAGALGEPEGDVLEGPGRAIVERLGATLASELGRLVLLLDGGGRVRWSSGALPGTASDGPPDPAAIVPTGLGPEEEDLWLELVEAALAGDDPAVGELALGGAGGGRPSLAVTMRRLGEDLVLAILAPVRAAEPAAAELRSSFPEAAPAPGWAKGPPPGLAEPSGRGSAEPSAPGLAEAPARGLVEAPAPPSTPPAAAGPDGAALLEAVAAALIGIDREGVVRLVNEAAARLFGLRAEDLVGRAVESLLGGVASTAELRALLLEQLPRSAGVRELLGLRGEAEPLPLEVAARHAPGAQAPLVLLTLRDATLARHTEETLRTLAYLDPLTGLPNRILFNDRLGQAIARARRARQLLAVLLLDLDRFKLVNDSLGLERGDQLLKAVGERLVATLRRSDTVARLGSDEFLVLLTGIEQAEAIVKVAHKLLAALQPPFRINGHDLTVSASVGVAVYPNDGDEPSLLVKNADTALGRAKELGRGHVQFYTNDMNAQAFERLMLENRLRRALENAELVVYYQPQLSLRTGAVVGVEALVRWFHPELGLVPPGEFIPLAEDTGLILPIGFWAMETACSQVRAWQQELGRPDLRLGVNLSARQFQHPELAARIADILARTGLAPGCLELELTESVVMREASESMRRMRELTALGLALAIDDFGTGYSSLAYLRSFPIRSLKIDRSFVQDVDRDPSSATIVQAIVAMGASLGLNVVAEGVETSQQLRQLRRMGCHEMQGFLVSRALPATDLLPVLRDGRLEADVFLLADGA